MSSKHEVLVPHPSYIRLHDVTGIERVKPGVKLDYFDFSPCQAKLTLQRGIQGEDRLPIHHEFADESEASLLIQSGNESYRKNFQSKVVSRKHATLRWMLDQPYPTLEDEKSTHGTFLAHLGIGASLSDVQEEKLSKVEWKQLKANEPMQLEDGDVIQLGKAVKRGEANYTPLRLFVEKYVVGQKPYWYFNSDRNVIDVDEAGETIIKLQFCSSDINLRDSESDDDVVEKEAPKLPKAMEQAKKSNNWDVTVILSDDESDGEDYQPDEEADEGLGEISEDDVESDKIQSLGGKDGKEENHEMVDDAEEVPSSPIEDVEEDDDNDENPSRASQFLLEHLDREAQHPRGFIEEIEAVLAPTHVASDERATSIVMQENGEVISPFITAPVEEVEQEIEMTTFSDSSSGSANDSSDSEGAATEITNVEVDITVPMKAVTMMDVDTSSSNSDEVKEDDMPIIQQLAGTKRRHDELEEVETREEPTTLEMVSFTTTKRIQHQSSPVESHKKLKTFSAGLAAGLLAGMVGTLVGLSSLALSDSSFL